MLEKKDIVTLGLNAYHADSSAAIYINNTIVAATEEERFSRIKHWSGFPKQSIAFCLKEVGIDIHRVNHITLGRNAKSKYNKKILFAIKKILTNPKYLINRLNNRKKIHNITEEFKTYFNADVTTKICHIEHHLSHLASAFFASEYKSSAIMSIDGAGDFTTTMLAYGEENTITPIKSIDFPISIGFLYTAFTQYLGFFNYGDEYKIMGLAPYGNPKYTKDIYKIIYPIKHGLYSWDDRYFNTIDVSYINHQPVAPIFFKFENIQQLLNVQPRVSKTDALTQEHKDIARSVQQVTEELIIHLAKHLKDITKSDNLCIAGGVAQNSVANGKLTELGLFKNVYIPSAGHDAGLSMGSALYQIHHILNKKRTYKIPTASLGIKFENIDIKTFLDHSCKYDYTFFKDDELFSHLAISLKNNNVIGWFQGRAEFGPRALGNRSIITNPANPNAKELLNEKIKRRESFRPFAPSILSEKTLDFFECYAPTPYMEKVFKIKKDKRSVIPAVTHKDGTGRLQTVEEHLSPRYYKLIKAFDKLTGIPILLNTSFNENEPIVNSIEEAYNCFDRTKMDMLVLENYVITKPPA